MKEKKPKDDEKLTVPVARETLSVERRRRPTGGVRLTKRVESEEIELDETLTTDRIEVRRVPIDRVLDAPVDKRQEGDTLVVPVMEERLVKQLVLVEEVHITRTRHSEHVSEPVELRRERVDIEDLPPDSQPSPD